MKKYGIYLFIALALYFLFKQMNFKANKKGKQLKLNKMNVKEFKNFMLPSAMMIEQKFKIPHLFTLSQIALETGFGKSELFYKYFNVGGIRSFKPESEPHGYYWTWEHVAKPDLQKWDKYERDKTKDSVLPNGKIKIRVKLPFRHFPDLVSGLAYWVNNVLLNKYFKSYVSQANLNPEKYAELLQSGKVKYATDINYTSKIKGLINQFKTV